MEDRFRLVFRGETLDGQHRAVVKRRVMEVLKIDAEKTDKLFSGKPVVLKRDADQKTATRYQTIFKEAGARLRVLPEPESDAKTGGAASATATPAASSTPPTRATPARPTPTTTANESGTGNPVSSERESPPASQPVTAGVDPGIAPSEAAKLIAGGGASAFSVADVGSDILAEKSPPAEAAVDLDSLDFDVADVGADMGPPSTAPPVAAPDTSHIELVDEVATTAKTSKAQF